jgi:hypothetical protein
MTSPRILDTDGNPSDSEEYGGTEEFSGSDPLFTGDVGQLPTDMRVTLVALLKRRYLTADRHPKEWRIVLENELALRTRLNDLFLELVIDRTYEVAYKKQATSDSGAKFPTLLYDQAYNREETILLVYLRRLTRSRQKAGDDAVFVDRAELIDEVATFRPPSATNHVQDNRSAVNAVDTLLKNDILLRTPVTDRFRVAPIIEVLLPVDRIQDLARWLRSQNGTEATVERSDEYGDTDGEIR